jgi:hypothetical protein
MDQESIEERRSKEMSRPGILFTMVTLVFVTLFLTGCFAPDDTPTPQVDAPISRVLLPVILNKPDLVPTNTPEQASESLVSNPDLVIQSFEILEYDWLITGGFEATAEVVVKNVGNGPAPAFEVGIIGVNREEKYVRFSFSYDPALTAELVAGQEVTLTGDTGLGWHGHFDVACDDESYDATLCAMLEENTLWLMAVADFCERDGAPDYCAIKEIDEANNSMGAVVVKKPQTSTPIPLTDTPIPPTDTSVPPSDTPVPPTNTPVPPTNTPVPPSDTPEPPTDTPIPPSDTPVPPTPVVILMDGFDELIVYNPNTFQNGGTNSNDIGKILAGLPIDIRIERTHLQWQRHGQILQQNPKLIIIHKSAFFENSTEGWEKFEEKFDEFLQYISNNTPNTPVKLLIYSRSDSPEEELKAYYENKYPSLTGRVNILTVVRKPDFTWSDYSTELISRVGSLLGIN